MFIAELDFRELEKLLEKGRNVDLSPAMSIVAEQFLAAVSDNFDSAGHGTWAPLAMRTHIGRRDAEVHEIGPVHHQILKDTGRLAGSQNAMSGPDFAEVSTDVSYAVFHVSDAPRKKIPLRNFYALPEGVWTTAIETILNEVVK